MEIQELKKLNRQPQETEALPLSSQDQTFKKIHAGVAFDLEDQEESSDSDGEESVFHFPVPQVALPVLVSPVTTSASPQAISATADVQMLFEQMAGTMLVLSTSGETETTLFLDSPHFSSSLFFGMRVTIKEFSTAPKAFNIEIASHPLAIACVQEHQASLLNAFQNGKFHFSIGRLETQIEDLERPLFKRKGPISQEEDEGSF